MKLKSELASTKLKAKNERARSAKAKEEARRWKEELEVQKKTSQKIEKERDDLANHHRKDGDRIDALTKEVEELKRILGKRTRAEPEPNDTHLKRTKTGDEVKKQTMSLGFAMDTETDQMDENLDEPPTSQPNP